jgi:glycosyltransferase involved in cell wall biosynthesis
MSSPAADATVVVPTHNRAPRLEALLRSLAAQRDVDFDVVVVDDGSDDGTRELLQRGVPGLTLQTIRNERPEGAAAARNAGWRTAGSPLIAFIDDDCVAAPGWLAALLEAHRASPGAIVQGPTKEDPGELERSTVFWRSLHFAGPNVYFATCNIAYPRELLERVGGFDESWRPFGEDTDTAWRAREAGADSVFAPHALVHHAVHQIGLVGMLRDARRYREVAHVLQRHPGFRSALYYRIFLLKTDVRLLAMMAGIALAPGTRGASLLLAAPYLDGYRRRHGGWPGMLATLPAYLVVDAARMLALAEGSVKYRTFIL